MTQAAADCLQRGYFHFHGKVTMEFNSSSAPFGICSVNGFGFAPIYSTQERIAISVRRDCLSQSFRHLVLLEELRRGP